MNNYAELRAALDGVVPGDMESVYRFNVSCHPGAIRALLAERDALRGRLEAAANYIDTLGGDSKGLRSALAQGEA